MGTVYTIDRVTDVTDELEEFFNVEGPKISAMFDGKLTYDKNNILNLVTKGIFLICRRNEEIRGYMICYLYKNPLDPKVKILSQLSFYVKPDSGRTAYHLFHKFIDIGKTEANHIITMLTSHTNIKPSTLKNLGFSELETLYRMEIS